MVFSSTLLMAFPVEFRSALLLLLLLAPAAIPEQLSHQYPQGYYPFEESPAKIPPKVRKPPYLQTKIQCPGVGAPLSEQTLDNLCGDLNKGYLPVNPIGQSVDGVSYPFELLKRKTLSFFSKTLPILKADDTLPKVAKYEDSHIAYSPTIFNSKPTSRISFYHHRQRREATDGEEDLMEEEDDPLPPIKHILSEEEFFLRPSVSSDANSASRQRQGRAEGGGGAAAAALRGNGGWCEGSEGVLCMLFNAFNGKRDGAGKATDRIGGDSDVAASSSSGGLAYNSVDSPAMTPCPSAVEYVTPVFAKNYQGVWRYVVQIPYEGYFTQTVEVVKCLSTKCEYLDGSCLASPRWVSLLVAEIYYPDTTFPSPGGGSGRPPRGNRQPVQGASPPREYGGHYFQRRQGQATPEEKCDGHDEMGCYQVRLYYDWFLIPGSCKCWKNDFFDQYTRRKK